MTSLIAEEAKDLEGWIRQAEVHSLYQAPQQVSETRRDQPDQISLADRELASPPL